MGTDNKESIICNLRMDNTYVQAEAAVASNQVDGAISAAILTSQDKYLGAEGLRNSFLLSNSFDVVFDIFCWCACVMLF